MNIIVIFDLRSVVFGGPSNFVVGDTALVMEIKRKMDEPKQGDSKDWHEKERSTY